MEKVKVEVEVSQTIDRVWQFWVEPSHIKKWNFAAESWECPEASNNLEVNGRFKVRMSAKDKSSGFDFEGTYTNIEKFKLIEYKMDDGREVRIEFEDLGSFVRVSEFFDPETVNSIDIQKQGWQAILDNFKKYCEGN